MSGATHLPHPSGTPDVLDSVDGPLADRARDLLARILPLELRDDRLDAWPAGATDHAVGAAAEGAGMAGTAGGTVDQPAAVVFDGDRLVVLVTGPVVEGRAELDALVAPDLADPAAVLTDAVRALEPGLVARGATAVQLWARPRTEGHEAAARALGAEPSRGLHQMRCRLPVDIEPLASRAYRPHDDLAAVRSVNNRAFASHPSQGGQSEDQLLATMAEGWFEPEGLRVHERDGRVAGFCWTKIHPGRPDPERPDTTSTPLGEIFVIGVDPDFHGRGLGAPMTAAGLSWLTDQGLATGMLYVETDNAPAVRTYEKLGFEIVRTDAAWLTPLPLSRPGS